MPDLAPLSTGATGGLRSVTPVEAPSAESPGVVLPTSQEDLPPHPPHPPHTVSVCVSYVAKSGVSNVGGSLSSGLGLTVSVSRGPDHLRVVNVAPSAVVSVASALSPGSLLFPVSDSGFASLSVASSSRPLSLPPPLSSSSFLASSSSGSASLLSSLPPPTPAFPSPFAPPSLSLLAPLSLLRLRFLPLPLVFLVFLLRSRPLLPLPLCSLTLRLLHSLLLFLLSVRPLRRSRLPLLSLLLLPLHPLPHRIRLQFWVCLMIISIWCVGISSLEVLIFVRIFLPSILSFLLMLLVISLLVLRSSSRPFVLLLLLVSSAALVFSQSPAPLPLAPPFSAPSSVPLPSSLGSLSVAQGWGASVVSSAPPGFPPLSAPSSSLCLRLQLLLLCLRLLLC